MSGPESGTTSPLLEEDQYSGKIFYLSSNSSVIDLEDLKQGLSDRKIHFEADFDDEDDKEELVVPRIFRAEDGSVLTVTTSTAVEYVERGDLQALTGLFVLDEPGIITFRDDRVLILDTLDVRFAVFSSGDDYFLVLLGKRELVTYVLEILSEELNEMNLSAIECEIKHSGIDNIADELADELLDTTFEDYPQPSIDKKRIWGRGYGEDPEYQKEKQRGNVRGHMMSTTELADGEEKVISVSDDGLIRSYSNLTLYTYLDMIVNYIIPNISTVQSTLKEWEENSG
jgi:hypothetical protein